MQGEREVVMKIDSSSISMASSHDLKSHSHSEKVTINALASKDAPAAIVSISAEASDKSYIESLKTYQEQEQEAAKQKAAENEKRSAQSMMEIMKKSKENQANFPGISEEYDMKIKMLKKMLEMLRGGKAISKYDAKMMKNNNDILDLRSPGFKASIGFKSASGFSASLNVSSLGASAADSSFGGGGRAISAGTTSTGTLWQKISVESGSTTELEHTAFASKGKVNTADGRSIDFNVSFSLSRATASEFNSISVQNYIVTDPLVINLDSNVASVTDQKFHFDLNVDGKEDEISFAGKGSGFLALDKNEDGQINDGSELFGARSGDGFKDLAEYDEDKNGWIDENDSVFSKLRVWTRDSEGNDMLMELKDADVGAIYLGNADTQYSLVNDSGDTDGIIRKTGIYLKESTGQAGTINHVDLAL